MLYKGGSEVRFLNFKVNGEDNINWFSQENLKSSYWNDLRNFALKSFTINGPSWIKRSFEISKQYGGCSNDAGWLVITDSSSEVCSWGKRGNSGTNILYSNMTNFVNFQNGK